VPASTWRGSITFGLITIPIRLYAAARSNRFQLHQLHRKCHTRLRQPLFCPHCNRIVERSEVVKGYEDEKGHYILIEPEEIKKILPESSRVMDILAFVKASEIDPLFFDSSFFVVAEKESQKAYQLLTKTLEDTERVAIAKVTMHQREYTAFIRPYDHGLALHTMYYANEIREAPGYGETSNVKISPQEIKLAQQLVETLAQPFQLKNYHDEFQDRLHALIEAKRKHHEVAVSEEEPAPKRAPVIDIMTALKRSLDQTKELKRAAPRGRKAPARHRAAS